VAALTGFDLWPRLWQILVGRGAPEAAPVRS
jgi:hypothetical protein